MSIADLAPTIDASTVERVLLHGDLQKLTPNQKISYYKAVCDSVGLNPLTQPFQYLVLNGKEILYARREATEQLRQLHHVSIAIVARELVDEIYVVTARATLPGGRTDENIGAVPLGTLKGDARANAMMKAETKAKRRATLAICGLGMLDETEVSTLPSASIGAFPPATTLPAVPPAAESRPTPADAPTDEPIPAAGESIPSGAVADPQWIPVDSPYWTIVNIDSRQTKNQLVTRHEITFSTGVTATTINSWLATLAEEYLEKKTPIRVDLKKTRWGDQIVKFTTLEQDQTQPSLQDMADADDIPF